MPLTPSISAGGSPQAPPDSRGQREAKGPLCFHPSARMGRRPTCIRTVCPASKTWPESPAKRSPIPIPQHGVTPQDKSVQQQTTTRTGWLVRVIWPRPQPRQYQGNVGLGACHQIRPPELVPESGARGVLSPPKVQFKTLKPRKPAMPNLFARPASLPPSFQLPPFRWH